MSQISIFGVLLIIGLTSAQMPCPDSTPKIIEKFNSWLEKGKSKCQEEPFKSMTFNSAQVDWFVDYAKTVVRTIFSKPVFKDSKIEVAKLEGAVDKCKDKAQGMKPCGTKEEQEKVYKPLEACVGQAVGSSLVKAANWYKSNCEPVNAEILKPETEKEIQGMFDAKYKSFPK